MEFLGDGAFVALAGAILGIVLLGLGLEAVDEALAVGPARVEPAPVSPLVLEPAPKAA